MFSSVLLLLILASISQTLSTNGTFTSYQARIINGEEAKINEIPYQISLQTSDYFHLCGGSLFSPFYVITAAHCVDGLRPEDVRVIVGTVHLNHPKDIHRVKKIIIHEEYTPGDSWRNDIALILLPTPLMPSRFIGYTVLPERSKIFKEGHTAVVSGFGRISQNGPVSRRLLRANISIASQVYCQMMYKIIQYNIHDSQICAHDPKMSTGVCNSDSGGPLVIDRELVGILSWSKGCSLTDFPTVFTRVSSYADWIVKQISLRKIDMMVPY